jgi:anti-sigma-K factor RskA
MDLRRHPRLLDQLAAEYALGTLRGGARRRLEALGARDAAVRLALESWQRRLEVIAELTPPQTPPVSVWHAIEARIGDERATVARNRTNAAASGRAREALRAMPAASRRRFDKLVFWRGWAIASTGAAIAAVAVLAFTLHRFAPPPTTVPSTLTEQPPSPGTPGKVGYVAVLNDNSAHTMMVVTYDDTRSMMTVHRMMPPREKPDQSMQVWGMTADGKPESLGVLPADRVVSMKVRHRLQDYVKIAVSVEPKGGSPDPNGPSGPVLYTGRIVPIA